MVFVAWKAVRGVEVYFIRGKGGGSISTFYRVGWCEMRVGMFNHTV